MFDFDLICVGRVSMDLFSQDIGAPFVAISGFTAHVGGSPTNSAIGATRLGLGVAPALRPDPVMAGDLVHPVRTAELDELVAALLACPWARAMRLRAGS